MSDARGGAAGHEGRLAGRTAVVVGGGQTPGETIGNGRATALRFAQEGARLLVVDRDIARAQDTVEAITAAGGEATAFGADITDAEQCAAITEAAVERLGRLDILHNNVGIGVGDGTPTTITPEGLDLLFDVNLKGMIQTCRFALPVMRSQRSGVIINISSVAAVLPLGLVGYKTTKAAVNAYTEQLASGNARYGIRVNAIMPGLMETPMAIESILAARPGTTRDQLIAERDRAVPLGGRMGSGWDIANAALFLASDEARFVTGVVLAVDGGQRLRVG
jgi:NAD(P)-dependent dehydrogenase (short-subunit alcohol dehydrogenase family)